MLPEQQNVINASHLCQIASMCAAKFSCAKYAFHRQVDKPMMNEE
jgi:hypothetical protein